MFFCVSCFVGFYWFLENARKHSYSFPFLYLDVHPISHSIHLHSFLHHLHTPHSSIPKHNFAREASRKQTATNIRKFLQKQSFSWNSQRENKGIWIADYGRMIIPPMESQAPHMTSTVETNNIQRLETHLASFSFSKLLTLSTGIWWIMQHIKRLVSKL